MGTIKQANRATTFLWGWNDVPCAGCVDHSDHEVYPKRAFNPDPYAATRMAIFLTAEEVRRKMTEEATS